MFSEGKNAITKMGCNLSICDRRESDRLQAELAKERAANNARKEELARLESEKTKLKQKHTRTLEQIQQLEKTASYLREEVNRLQ